MNCANCGSETSQDDRFCSECGTPLTQQPGAPPLAPGEGTANEDADRQPETSGTAAAQAGRPGLQEQVQTLQTTLDGLRGEVRRNAERLRVLERMFGVPDGLPAPQQPAQPQPTGSQPAATQAAGPPVTTSEALPPVQHVVTAATPPLAPASQQAASGWAGPAGPWQRVQSLDWEWLFGGNWLARIGVVALIVGVGFFLKLAFDNQWIGEIGRVVLGIIGGLALLGLGEFWRRRYPVLAQPLTGGGLAILYLAVYAAFSLYELIPPLPALGFFFLVTLAAAGLALRYEAVAIAVIGILSGFATPLLMADQQLSDQRVLLPYVLVLDLGVLALATFRNWRWFTLLGLIGSLLLFQFWREELDPGLLLAEVGLTVIFLIFVGATTLFHLLWRRTPGRFDQSLVMLNGMAYFLWSLDVMSDDLGQWMGGFAVILALFYGLLGYGILLRHREQVLHSLFAIGLALVFLTVAVPLQLDGPWVGVAWAVEGTVLIWVSNLVGISQFRLFAAGAFAILIVRVMIIDSIQVFDEAGLRPFLNYYTVTYAAAIASCYVGAYLLYREGMHRRGPEEERPALESLQSFLFPVLLVAGTVILTVGIPGQSNGVWTSITWAVEGVALIGLSLRLGLVELRLFGLGVLAVTVVRLLAFDTFDVDYMLFRPVINERFLAFAVGIAAFYLSAYALWRLPQRHVDPRERFLAPVMLIAASFLTLWVLSAEVIASVDSDYFDVPARIADNVISLSLSILWAVYAGVLLVAGIRLRNRWVRLAGLGLLAIPIIKLFVFDTFDLEREYRVAAYLGLGAILVVGGFLYQRYSRVIRGFLLE